MVSYQIRQADGSWKTVSKRQYVRWERRAGFHNTNGQPDEPATAAFKGRDDIEGRMRFGK